MYVPSCVVIIYIQFIIYTIHIYYGFILDGDLTDM
jgi:hypothetical protein